VISGWRLYQRRFAAIAFSGEGARSFGGRWNSPGTPMIYTASTPALAALEMLVHLDRADLLRQYRLRQVRFDPQQVERLAIATLPKNWRRAAGGAGSASLRRIGDLWVAERRSLVLAVPSAVSPAENNYLINPAHPEFGSIRVEKEQMYQFDPRLK
jgi:RES domain-containing protein